MLASQPLEVQVELQYVHPLFSQKTELAALYVASYQVLHRPQWQVPRVGHPGRLEHQ